MFQSVSTWFLADLCDGLLRDKYQKIEKDRNAKIVEKLVSLVEYLPDKKLFNEISHQRAQQRIANDSVISESVEKLLEKLTITDNNNDTKNPYSIIINSK